MTQKTSEEIMEPDMLGQENTSIPDNEKAGKSKGKIIPKLKPKYLAIAIAATVIMGSSILFYKEFLIEQGRPTITTDPFSENDFRTIEPIPLVEETTSYATDTNGAAPLAPSQVDPLNETQYGGVDSGLNSEFRDILELHKQRLDDLSQKLELRENQLAQLNQKIEMANNRVDGTNNRINGVAKEVATVRSNATPLNLFTQLESKVNQDITGLHDRADFLQNEFWELKSNLETKATQSKVESRKRLAEFKLLKSVVDGVYSVQAPNKNGRSNYITLWEGETFRSKLGPHKVTGIVNVKDGMKLLVDDSYFIDDVWEDFAEDGRVKGQLAKSTAAKITRAKVVRTEQKPTATQQTLTSVENIGKTEPSSASVADDPYQPRQEVASPITIAGTGHRPVAQQQSGSGSVQYKNGRILLNDWRVIDAQVDKQAVVVNMASLDRRAITLRMENYYEFFGKVNSVTSNTICSEQYCIGGLE
ncbi:hypothetical protein [Vibrio navarrensis]|uniref:hypothetical protein n=1 Tax=Vibrio navarrensis TaxID=29495 RepID=UPI00186874A7|nr:hypothetical protein [Vibrio navarrensis]